MTWALEPAPDGHIAALARLYEEGLSTRQIAARTGLPRPQITRALHRAGLSLSPRGRGRARPSRRIRPPEGIATTLTQLYVEQRLTRAQVAHELGVPEHRVRAWLRECGIRPRHRGPHDRLDRDRPGQPELQELYAQRQLPARAVAVEVASSLGRVLSGLHDAGVAVRLGGNAGPQTATVLLDILYADDLVRDALSQHGIPVVSEPGPLAQRFPRPHPLSKALLVSLYRDCGLSISHVELLTGQPSTTVRRTMHRTGVPPRRPGGRSPFLQRAHQRPARSTRTGSGHARHRRTGGGSAPERILKADPLVMGLTELPRLADGPFLSVGEA